MELMKELIEAAKVSRSAAHAVYHRDYIRTKKKPYRKYDPRKHAAEEEESSDMVCVYFDSTGAGRSPEPVAGPFSRADAKAWIEENEVDGDNDYFIDVAHDDIQEAHGYAKAPRLGPKRDWDAEHDKRRQKALDDKPDLPGNQKWNVTEKGVRKPVYVGTSKAEAQTFVDKQSDKSKYTITGVSTPVREGAFDFIKGAAQHVGNTVKQGVQNTVTAGKRASKVGDLSKEIAQLANALATYDKLKPAAPAPQQAAQQPQQQEPPRRPTETPGSAPAAFRTTTKPKARMGQHGLEMQFSSYLQFADNDDLVTEGAWDFIKGAAGHVGNAVATGVKDTVAAGTTASNAADLTQATTAAKQSVVNVIRLLRDIGPGALEQFTQIAQQTAGGASRRLITVVLNSAKKMGVQLS